MGISNLICVLAVLITAGTCYAQITTIKINYHLDQLTNTAGPNLGYITPISDQYSIINFGYVRLAMLDNNNGEVLKEINETNLVTMISEAMSQHATWINYKLYGLDEQNKIPHLFKARIQYSKVYKVDEQTLAVGVSLPVSKIIPDFANDVLAGVVFMNHQLQVKKFIIREWYHSDLAVTLSCGGYFMNDSAFYISCEVPGGVIPDQGEHKFMHYALKDGIFKIDKEKSIGELPRIFDFSVGRSYSIFKRDYTYYIFNGESLWETADLSCIDIKHKLPLKGQEMFMSLMPVGGRKYAGVVSDLGDEGAGERGDLVILNKNLCIEKILTRYESRQFTLNSVEYHNGKLYIYIVDQKKTLPLLQIIKLNE